MDFKNKIEKYSIRKFKIGVGSALIGFTLLGAVGLLDQLPVVGDVFNVQSVSADEAVPKPEGNVVARGEDGVPWELYDNGYLLFKPVDGKDTLTSQGGDSTWKREHGSKIKHVGFAGKVYAPKNSSYLFSKEVYTNYRIDRKFNPMTLDTTNLDTSNVTDMSYMFGSLSNLTDLDVTHFNTKGVTNMYGMFSSMYNLTNLDVSNFDMSEVKHVGQMFSDLTNLNKLKIGNKFKSEAIASITHYNYGDGNDNYTEKWYKTDDSDHVFKISS